MIQREPRAAFLLSAGALGGMLALLCSDGRLRRHPALAPVPAPTPAPVPAPVPAPGPIPGYRAALHSLVEGIKLSGQNLYRDAVLVL